jgi:toxin secretion/phage lysis holin
MNRYILGASALLGTLATLAEQYTVLIVLVAAAIVLDVITGLIRCGATGEKLSSEKGTKGFWKKIMLMASLLFAFFLDVSIPTILGVVNVTLPFQKSLLFGSIVGVYIILNESISICENILKANKMALPKWLKKLLQDAKKEVDEKGAGKDADNK